MAETTLLPNPANLRVEYVSASQGTITLVVSTIKPAASCPLCGMSSARVHSRYQRTVQDLPWQGIAVRLTLRTRRFFCDNRACERAIFTERLPGVIAHYARKTERLQDALYLIGYALGGEAGARVAAGLGLSVSPDTLLQRVRQAGQGSSTESSSVRVLGVDDWAFRRGQRYGTILVDLERRCLVDLLPDRTADTLTAWLKQHPGIEIISRDRASAYAEAARAGAPQARQVADRFHLLKNVTDALERVLIRHHRALREVARQNAAEMPTAPRILPTSNGAKPSRPLTQTQQDRRERRLARYQWAVELQQQGCSQREIARRMRLSRNTVQKWLLAGGFREWAQPPPRRTRLARFAAYLQQRWQEGCHNASVLHKELQQQGFRGSVSAVQRHVQTWRDKPRARVHRRREEPPSVRCVLWWLLDHYSQSDPSLRLQQRGFIDQLLSHCPEVKAAQELVLQFASLVKERRATELSSWLEAVQSSALPELKGFAKSLRLDLDAVEAALSSSWSNGQVEGQVHRLKLIKRQMYGRAKFDLLRARVLPIANAV